MKNWGELIIDISKVRERVQVAVDRLAKPGEEWQADYHRQSLEIYLETTIKRPGGNFVARGAVRRESDLESVMDSARKQIENLLEQRKEIVDYVHGMHTKYCR